jgi:adenylate kinase family enzyme
MCASQAAVVTTVPADVTVLLILGAPGAGKSSTCLELAKEGNFVHIPCSDLLKEEMAAGTKVRNHTRAPCMSSYTMEGALTARRAGNRWVRR